MFFLKIIEALKVVKMEKNGWWGWGEEMRGVEGRGRRGVSFFKKKEIIFIIFRKK